MKSLLCYLTAGVLLTLVISCSKDKKDQPAPASYMMHKTGNYWVYREVQIAGSGAETPMGIDSIYVEKDTTIRNRQFYKLMISEGGQPADVYKILSDSLSYIINYVGGVEFSSSDFTTVFRTSYEKAGNDTIAKVQIAMADKDLVKNVPAGSFVTRSSRKTYFMYPGWQQLGATRHMDARYAVGIGLVSEVYALYASTPDTWERRLLRYHVN